LFKTAFLANIIDTFENLSQKIWGNHPFHPLRSQITIFAMSSTCKQESPRGRYHFNFNTTSFVAAAMMALRRIVIIADHDAGTRRNECVYLGIWNKVGEGTNVDVDKRQPVQTC